MTFGLASPDGKHQLEKEFTDTRRFLSGAVLLDGGFFLSCIDDYFLTANRFLTADITLRLEAKRCK